MHLDIRAGHKTDIATIKCDGYGCNLLDEGYLDGSFPCVIQQQKYTNANTEIQQQKVLIATIKCDGYGCNLLDEGYLRATLTEAFHV